MAFFGEAEPFEESQGRRAQQASQAELQSFYKQAQKGDLERKLSKRKSTSAGSIWSRKSTKRNSVQPQQHPGPPPPVSGPSRSFTSPSATSLARPPPTTSDHGTEWSDSVLSLPLARSIIPDTLRELPAWYRDSAHFNTRYPMHNPVGPKWYANHHLVAPSGTRPAGPPSVFSSSFPPMASSGDRGEDPRMPGMSRSPSKSTLPTPNSSQTRMEDVSNMPRSRKTSQTAHDNVDLMASDPWGTAWHHESPYDVGKSNSPVSFEETQATRSRSSSVTAAQNRRKTVTPSPLSQSTSAVHLQAPEASRPVTRKLSKRRTVGIFGRHTASAPVSPIDGLNSRVASPAQVGPPSSFTSVEAAKKDRRTSVLGRIAKRFSLTRKPTVIAPMMEVVRHPSPQKRQPSPEKPRAPELSNSPPPPPPLFHQEPPIVALPPEPQTSTPNVDDDDNRSSISFDATYRMGRLMVANPDPGSAESTPIPREMHLPSEEPKFDHSRESTADTLTPASQWENFRTQSPEAMPQLPSPRSFAALSTEIAIDQSYFALRTESPPPPTPLPKSPLPTPAVEIPVARSPSPTKPHASPEKSSQSFANDHRFERPVSAIRPAVESPASNGASSSRRVPPPTVQSIENARATRPPSPKLPAVPFPMDYGPPPGPPPRPNSMARSQMTAADISPLSAVSVLVNPPTPYNPDAQMPDDDSDAGPPPVPSKRASRDPSPSQVAVTGRETETFRLVRSASGTVYASTETIRAAGEQWEVMESSKSKGKRRQAKEVEPERQGRSERKRRSPEAGASNSQTFPRSGSQHQRSVTPETFVAPEASPRKREADRKSAHMRLDKPQPAPPPLSRTLERNPSNSVRPISEVPPTADMNQMRAREAWDMDRLWKARSLSGMESNGFAVPPPLPAKERLVEAQQLGAHGSSHTAFLMSAPFQQQPPPPIYHSMPPVPVHSPVNGHSTSSHPYTPLRNPLPEPPRESPYQPAPLTLPEHWGKHANAATAH
ncbi:hypothetical protein C8F01DRAFT_1362634 [Mycena amicta]|nr:hypothetical protein C8F01DRAFT_1362634 [Mycena amicta]